jgi:hypothetical protein
MQPLHAGSLSPAQPLEDGEMNEHHKEEFLKRFRELLDNYHDKVMSRERDLSIENAWNNVKEDLKNLNDAIGHFRLPDEEDSSTTTAKYHRENMETGMKKLEEAFNHFFLPCLLDLTDADE